MEAVHVPTNCFLSSLLFFFLQIIFAFLYPGLPERFDGVHGSTADCYPRHDHKTTLYITLYTVCVLEYQAV